MIVIAGFAKKWVRDFPNRSPFALCPCLSAIAVTDGTAFETANENGSPISWPLRRMRP